jgi:hypothetical protein
MVVAGLLQLMIEEVNSIVMGCAAKDTVTLGIRISNVLKPLGPFQQIIQPNFGSKIILFSQIGTKITAEVNYNDIPVKPGVSLDQRGRRIDGKTGKATSLSSDSRSDDR